MQEEREWGHGCITWRHDSVSIFRTVYRAILRFNKEHLEVKLGVSKQEVKSKATAGRIQMELRQSQVLGSNKTTLIVK